MNTCLNFSDRRSSLAAVNKSLSKVQLAYLRTCVNFQFRGQIIFYVVVTLVNA